jgi:hypothetical protein
MINGNPKKLALWSFVVLVIFGLVSLTACKGKSASERMAERAIEKATGGKAKVDIAGGKIKISDKGEKAELSFAQEWPNDLPGDVPKFTMGKVKAVTKAEEGGKPSWHIILQDVEDGAVEKYTEELKAKGWEIEMSNTAGEGGLIQAKKNNQMLIFGYNKNNKNGTVQVITEAK